MENNYENNRLLFSLLKNPEVDVEWKIFNLLYENLEDTKNSSKDYTRLVRWAVYRTSLKKPIDYKSVDSLVEFVLKIAQKLASQGLKQSTARVINILCYYDTEILMMGYPDITLGCKEYLGDEKAKVLLRNVFEHLKDKSLTNHTRIDTSECDGKVEKDVWKDVSVHQFTKLAYTYVDLFGNGDNFPNEVIEYATQFIGSLSFDELEELGQWYANTGDIGKASEFWHRSEKLIESFDDLWVLIYHIWYNLPQEHEWGMELMFKAIKSCCCSEDYVRLAEVCGSTSEKGFHDVKLCLELYDRARKVATCEKELESLRASMLLVQEDWDNKMGEINEGS